VVDEYRFFRKHQLDGKERGCPLCGRAVRMHGALWSHLGAYRAGLAGRPMSEMLLWVSATNHLIRKMMSPPPDNWKEPHIPRPWSL